MTMDKMIQMVRQAKIESVSFQSGDSEKDKSRYYFSVDACQTQEPNDQHYLFMPDSVESTIAGYSDGQPVMVNHHTWGIDGLGFGATVGGEYNDPDYRYHWLHCKGLWDSVGSFHEYRRTGTGCGRRLCEVGIGTW